MGAAWLSEIPLKATKLKAPVALITNFRLVKPPMQNTLRNHSIMARQMLDIILGRLAFFFSLVFLITFNACSTVCRADTIALFYALDEDLESVRETLIFRKSHTFGDRTIHEFHHGGHQIYTIKMGSGCITTAVSATLLLSKFQTDHAFSIGPAAGIVNEVAIGDWFFVDTHVSYQIGSVKPGGFTPTGSRVGLSMPAELGLGAADATSGERFIASTQERQRLAALSGAELLEMNLGGLIEATQNFEVPLYCIRVVSDFGDDNANRDFEKFLSSYEGEGSSLFLDWLHKLPPNLDSPQAHENLRNLLEDVDLGLTPTNYDDD